MIEDRSADYLGSLFIRAGLHIPRERWEINHVVGVVDKQFGALKRTVCGTNAVDHHSLR